VAQAALMHGQLFNGLQDPVQPCGDQIHLANGGKLINTALAS
jgi:hypothetical protein